MSPREKSEPQQTTFIKPTPPPVKNGDILDVDEAAALLKVSKKTIYIRVKNNTIPYARLAENCSFTVRPLKNGLPMALTGRIA